MAPVGLGLFAPGRPWLLLRVGTDPRLRLARSLGSGRPRSLAAGRHGSHRERPPRRSSRTVSSLLPNGPANDFRTTPGWSRGRLPGGPVSYSRTVPFPAPRTVLVTTPGRDPQLHLSPLFKLLSACTTSHIRNSRPTLTCDFGRNLDMTVRAQEVPGRNRLLLFSVRDLL